MPRLAALLLLVLSFTPTWGVAGELARAGGATDIGVSAAAPENAVAPRTTSTRLLYGGPIIDLEAGSGSPSLVAAGQNVCRPREIVSLPAQGIPLPPSCTPLAQRLPYHATAPPTVG